MLEKELVKYCAPTLAGIKTASLFTAESNSVIEADAMAEKMNGWLMEKGLCLDVLNVRGGRALLYLFRLSWLKKDLLADGAQAILKEIGYSPENPGSCLELLKQRIHQNEDFPHEIGLFLGYPPEDVQGFIDKKKCVCYGMWKVYVNAEETLRLFEKYDRCTRTYEADYRQGMDLRQLAVAI